MLASRTLILHLFGRLDPSSWILWCWRGSIERNCRLGLLGDEASDLTCLFSIFWKKSCFVVKGQLHSCLTENHQTCKSFRKESCRCCSSLTGCQETQSLTPLLWLPHCPSLKFSSCCCWSSSACFPPPQDSRSCTASSLGGIFSAQYPQLLNILPYLPLAVASICWRLYELT